MAAGNNGRKGVQRLPYHRLSELVRCGVFVVNNLHTKPKKKVSIVPRKIVDHLEVLHVCGGEPAHMFAWPDYGDNCQILNDIAACKVSYSLFFYNLFGNK